jgi:hypothetical protein
MIEVGWFAVAGVRLKGLPLHARILICLFVFICVSKFLLGPTELPTGDVVPVSSAIALAASNYDLF